MSPCQPPVNRQVKRAIAQWRKNTPQEHSAKTPDSSDSANIGSGHHSSTDKNKPKATDSGLSLTDVAENDLEIFEQRFRD